MPLELVQTIVALAFLAVCAMAAQILVWQRRHEGPASSFREGTSRYDFSRRRTAVPSPIGNSSTGRLPHRDFHTEKEMCSGRR